jgi:putative ABC transport system substrate-binding protein
VRRRAVLAALAGVPAVRAAAQQSAMPVIGILGEAYPEDPAVALNLTMFFRGLRQEGFVVGRNVTVDYRWAHNHPDQLPKLAAELAGRPVNVIVNEGGTVTAVQAKKATSTIPIVFHASNAIEDGLVDNLARPTGNLTGVSQFATQTLVKGFQYLTELVPTAKLVGLVTISQAQEVSLRVLREIEASDAAKDVKIEPFAADNDAELERIYAALAGHRAVAIVFANATYVETLVMLASRYRVAAAYNQRAYVVAGGLLSYGASIPAAYLIKGIYTGKILKGAKPADLPVQQASKFELAINLKTAESLGLSVPQSILLAADEVIE